MIERTCDQNEMLVLRDVGSRQARVMIDSFNRHEPRLVSVSREVNTLAIWNHFANAERERLNRIKSVVVVVRSGRKEGEIRLRYGGDWYDTREEVVCGWVKDSGTGDVAEVIKGLVVKTKLENGKCLYVRMDSGGMIEGVSEFQGVNNMVMFEWLRAGRKN